MAYPFTPLPTADEFIKRLAEDFDCEYKSEDVLVNDRTFTIKYFERNSNGTKETCSIQLRDDTSPLPPSVVRSVCTKLNINPSSFGLHLDSVF